MKHNQEQTIRLQHGAFTLVEMLVVIAIIAIMASILVPVVGRAKTKSKVAAARVEMAGLELAIKSYHNDYSRWPVPKKPSGSSGWANKGEDFTYDTDGAVSPRGNEALMEILMAEAGDHNTGHERNPKKNKYIEPKESGDTNDLPGFSTTGRYHDPFGNPYIVSLDLNGDGVCADATYCEKGFSESAGSGLVGLVKFEKARPDAPPPDIPPDVYVYKGEVMIWSFGPDKLKGSVARSDNILSWQ